MVCSNAVGRHWSGSVVAVSRSRGQPALKPDISQRNQVGLPGTLSGMR